MAVELSLYRTLTRKMVSEIVRAVPESIRRSIELPASENHTNQFTKRFSSEGGIMIFARDSKDGRLLGTINAMRGKVHYIPSDQVLSNGPTVTIHNMTMHEISGAYTTEDARGTGAYSLMRGLLEMYAIENNIGLYSVVRHHSGAMGQAIKLLGRLLNREIDIDEDYKEVCRRLRHKSIPRSELKGIEFSSGYIHPDALGVYKRWCSLVESGNARLLGYWIAAFTPVYVFTPKSPYARELRKRMSEAKFKIEPPIEDDG